MALATLERWRKRALLCTIGSLFGGEFGFLLGRYALEALTLEAVDGPIRALRLSSCYLRGCSGDEAEGFT